MRAINPEIIIEPVCADVTAANIGELVARADLVMDGTDNFETRFLLNDAAVQAGKPWVYGGVLGTDGMVMAVRPGQGPCLRCLFDLPPPGGRLPGCDAFGVLNAAAVWVASLQVAEALKILTGVPQEHKLHILDIRGGTVSPVTAERRPDCQCCGGRDFKFLGQSQSAEAVAPAKGVL